MEVAPGEEAQIDFGAGAPIIERMSCASCSAIPARRIARLFTGRRPTA
jgi:hypothetical protein